MMIQNWKSMHDMYSIGETGDNTEQTTDLQLYSTTAL